MVAMSLRMLKRASRLYVSAGRPLLPITRWVREPLRLYYHRSPVLRHDISWSLRARALGHVHHLLVGDLPAEFDVWGGRLRFRSTGSVMAVHGYYVGEIEYHLCRFIVGCIKPGFVVIDVGAHHGIHSLVVAYELAARGFDGRVVAFEPCPENRELLISNLALNGLSRYVSVRPEAASDRAGQADFMECKEDNSNNTLSENEPFAIDADQHVARRRVTTITLDSLIDDLPRVDLVKIDVQGSEPRVLAGAEALITRHRPVIVVEAVPGWPTTSAIRDFLRHHHYSVKSVDADGNLCALESPHALISWDWVGVPR